MLKGLLHKLSNLPGWRTKRKIVVFESDDWGSIRMPSKYHYQQLTNKGLDLSVGDSARYNKYDTLASKEDLTDLFDLLIEFKDKNGNYPVFTAVSVVANPDFEKIRLSNFQEYFYEPFTTTLDRYNLNESFNIWQLGIKEKLFYPQFHAREHLNVASWMRALQKNDKMTHLAFDHGFWGFRNKKSSPVNYQAAFDLENPSDLILQKEILTDGLKLFEKIHGYKARFFVPPNGPVNIELIRLATQLAISCISTAKIQMEPIGNNKFRTRFHYLGQKITSGSIYLTRNAFFEPSDHAKDWIDACMYDISQAFKFKKPVVISTHRVNYIGTHSTQNRDNGLNALKLLLYRMLREWPEIEFMTSNMLGETIMRKNNA